MTDDPRPGARPEDDPTDAGKPELHNAEQDDEGEQTQTVAADALDAEARQPSPLDSIKSDESSGLMNDSTQDLVDHMRDMEQSGRIDMDAYRGEPNLDDNEDKYGQGNKVDDLPADGSGQKSQGARR
jgi:hypothetical protein